MSTRTRYAVSEGNSVRDHKGQVYQPGQFISERNLEEIGQERIENWVKRGYVERIDVDVPDDAAPVPGEEVSEEPSPAQQRRDEGDTVTSKWNYSPEDVAGLDLDELNLLILDIDDEAEPAQTPDEARARLTQGYIPEA